MTANACVAIIPRRMNGEYALRRQLVNEALVRLGHLLVASVAAALSLQCACSSNDSSSERARTDGGLCPATAPAQGTPCAITQRCVYEVPIIGCATQVPTFDCVGGKWTSVHFDAGPTATCPNALPPSGAVCPPNAPCMGDVQGLQCNYGCVIATCFEGAPWTFFSRCDASTDSN